MGEDGWLGKTFKGYWMAVSSQVKRWEKATPGRGKRRVSRNSETIAEQQRVMQTKLEIRQELC